jgi:transcriptional regulator with XRE-family HTH domain
VVKRDTQDERYVTAIDALRAARRSASLSQTQLALRLGKRQQYVSKYESGERRLDVIEFLDAADALGLSIDTLLRDAGVNRANSER